MICFERIMLVLITIVFFLLGNSFTATAQKWFPTNKNNCQIWNANPKSGEIAYWSGKCVNGKAHGYGILHWSGGSKYLGQYNYGYMDGFGKLTFGNEEKEWVGDSYVGEFKRDLMHGEGVYTYSSGKVDEGIWNQGWLVKKQKVKDLEKRFTNLQKNYRFEKNYKFKNESKPSISSAELEKEKQKRKILEQKLASLEKEKQKRIEEERKRKQLEKKLATLQSEKKKQIKKDKQNEIGSGFYVSKFRHIITNQHVVNKCNKITVGNSMTTQIPAELIASDKRNDLAILQTVSMDTASADTKSFVQKLAIQIVPVLSGGLIRPDDVVGGEEIFVAGFPLGNMVSDQMKLTDGIVSATKGLDNDVSQFEISSVVRKGNSGGPIYDSKGNIVGVAVSRLNVNRSDNVNFAIKGSTVKQFLSAHNVSTKWSNRQEDMSTKDIYKIASKQTVMVVCYRE